MAHILIVEDHPANCELATLLLESAGHTVSCAGTALEGLAQAQVDRPALILMDINLPGMDGLQATQWLKRDPSTRRIPVVALTALVMEGDEVRMLAAGCDAYIAKPIRVRPFLDTVAALVRAYAPQPH